MKFIKLNKWHKNLGIKEISSKSAWEEFPSERKDIIRVEPIEFAFKYTCGSKDEKDIPKVLEWIEKGWFFRHLMNQQLDNFPYIETFIFRGCLWTTLNLDYIISSLRGSKEYFGQKDKELKEFVEKKKLSGIKVMKLNRVSWEAGEYFDAKDKTCYGRFNFFLLPKVRKAL